jgi:hypothetical protein
MVSLIEELAPNIEFLADLSTSKKVRQGIFCV